VSAHTQKKNTTQERGPPIFSEDIAGEKICRRKEGALGTSKRRASSAAISHQPKRECPSQNVGGGKTFRFSAAREMRQKRRKVRGKGGKCRAIPRGKTVNLRPERLQGEGRSQQSRAHRHRFPAVH